MKKGLITGFILSFFVGCFTVSAAPVNSNFNDDNFYGCVIASYNDEKSTEYDATHNLTDSELASLNHLECADTEISDLKGFEKLTGLTELTLLTNGLTSIDLSDRVGLKKIWFYGNAFGPIDLSNNTNLEFIYYKDPSSDSVIHIGPDNDKESYIKAIFAGSKYFSFSNLRVVSDSNDTILETYMYDSDYESKLSEFLNNVKSNDYSYITITTIDTVDSSVPKVTTYKLYFDDSSTNTGNNTTGNTNTNTNTNNNTNTNGTTGNAQENKLAQDIMECYAEGNCPIEYDLDKDGTVDSADASYALANKITSLPKKGSSSVENPKTGIYGCIGILGISAIAGVYYFVNKKNKIVKI